MTSVVKKIHIVRPRAFRRNCSVALALSAVLLATKGFAQAPPQSATAPGRESLSAVGNYWTPERLINAKPMQLHPAPSHRLAPLSAPEGASGPSGVKAGDGAAPAIAGASPIARQLHPAVRLPERSEGAPESQSGPAPLGSSSTGAYFTTSRVFPDAATVTYPYLTGGKFFFQNPRTGQNWVCSASVLRPRLVVTAGHCVYHAGPTKDDPSNNKYFYSNFLFIPAYDNGSAPKGTWNWAWVIVSGYWSGGNGSVPNTQDIAIIETIDQGGHKIWEHTGYLGYQTGQLLPNHLTILGYPCNIDNCAKMQNTAAQSFANGGSNTVIYGSAQRGGTSGGPWIQDFGVAGAGAPSGTALNRLKSVSSYGPIALEPKYIGGSILLASGTSSFIDILNRACAHRAGNC
ncbi:MAG: hypothetical protein L0Y50_01335 [Beijerinckiaceae bacterium]|nr:hypothetical protein [Beijerinckiaceae bacterium]MCI0734916.1 hypothetical protein [Beijerinckiaceae bacterium]